MVGRVLRNHGIVEKEDGGYSLVGYEDLDEGQVKNLIRLCEAKLDEYKARWAHLAAQEGIGRLRLRDAQVRGAEAGPV